MPLSFGDDVMDTLYAITLEPPVPRFRPTQGLSFVNKGYR
jgi:hypothetical protein